MIPIYDWNEDSGYQNLADWIATAPRRSEMEGGGVSLGHLAAGAAVVGLGVLLWRAFRRQPPQNGDGGF